MNEMKAKQEDVIKERERQIAVGKLAESHLSLEEAPNKAKQAAARQVRVSYKLVRLRIILWTVCYHFMVSQRLNLPIGKTELPR